MSKAGKKALFYLGLALVALLGLAAMLGAAELYCRLRKTCAVQMSHYDAGSSCRYKYRWNWWLPVGCERHRKATFGGKTIYDMQFSGEGERRFVPDGRGYDKKYTALFFGCSYTYGDGVNDNQTTANIFARNFPEAETKNLGVGGGGPTNALGILEDEKSFADLEPRGANTIGIYGLIGSHVMRVSGRGGAGCGWLGRAPRYEHGEGGKLVRAGKLSDSCPVPAPVTQFLMQNSQLFRALQGFLYYGPKEPDFQLTADLIIAARDAFRARFGSENFFVFRYPDPAPRAWGDDIIRRLKEADVKVLDYIDLVDFNDPRFRIPGDVHPTALAHEQFGRALARDIRKALRD